MPGGAASAAGYRAGQAYSKWEAHRHDEIEVDYKQLDDSGTRLTPLSPPTCFNGRKGTVLKVLILVVMLCIGLILGYVLRRSVHEYVMTGGSQCAYTDGFQGYSADVSVKLKEFIQAKRIEKNLKNYSQQDHQSGTHNNNVLRDVLMAEMAALPGLSAVRQTPYNVTLSSADWERPNTISLLDSNGTVRYTTQYEGPAQFNMHPELMYAYNAFAPNGTVTGELVYAGFGETANFDQLAKYNIEVNGSIVLMRLGRLYKGQMVQNAAVRGAAAAILFTDPHEVVAPNAHLDQDVWPAQWWLPGWAVQRGTILPSVSGDPATPGLPATPGMHRIDDMLLPSIPVQPIGYKHAHDIMLNMTGHKLPDTQGANLASITYKSGPGYEGPRKGWKARVEVNNELYAATITNIVGVINGHEEPDRYVIVGCHYDAWTFGGVDPGTGTAILMELAAAFSQLTQHGWRPRRTLMFVHWDGEEQALMGSYEFVEEHYKELAERTVAYINLDVAVRGNYSLDVQASPMLRQLIMNVTHMFPSATNDSKSLYEEWRKEGVQPDSGDSDDDEGDVPHILPIGGGSDQAAFIYMLGVAALWPRYTFNVKPGMEYSRTVPAYHTTLDTFQYVKDFIDPEFKAHESLAWAVGEMVLELATFTKLPFDVRELADSLGELVDSLHTVLLNHGVMPTYLTPLKDAVGNFSVAAAEFHSCFMDVNIANVLTTRAYNDKLLRVSQAFILPEGLPGRPQFKNILFGPPSLEGYSCHTFPGICEAFNKYRDAKAADTKQRYLQQLQKQVSIATLAVRSAANTLTDDILKPANHG